MKHVLMQSDSGKTLTIPHGDEVQVKLDENPTTGYKWHPENVGDVSVSSVYQSSDRHNSPGSGGDQTFTFKPGKGSSSVHLKHRRSWDKEDPIEEFKLNFHVA